MELVEGSRRLWGEGRGTGGKVVEGYLDGECTIAHELKVVGQAGGRTGNFIYEAFDVERKVLRGNLESGDNVIQLFFERRNVCNVVVLVSK